MSHTVSTSPAVAPSTQKMSPGFHPGIDAETLGAVPELWSIAAQQYGSVVALHDPHSQPEVKLTYGELYQRIQQFAAGLQSLGVNPGNAVALFSDNSPRWMVADQGTMLAGAIDAVRGSQSDANELKFILKHSDSIGLIVQDLATLNKVVDELAALPIQWVILLSDEPLPSVAADASWAPLSFTQVLDLGAKTSLEPVAIDRNTLATLMYTSGTSGTPKGVMLSHGNLLSQVSGATAVVAPQPGERVLSILPIWHSYERTFEYFVLSHGCTQIYTNIRYVKQDLKQFQPHYMVGVPRLWESIYEGVQKQFREQPASKQMLVNFFLERSDHYIQAKRLMQGLCLDRLTPSLWERVDAALTVAILAPFHALGNRLVYGKVREGTGGHFKFIVSGGGSIAEHLEDFFEIVGIEILGGYGLTETSPITHARRTDRNLRGADGQPLPHTETRIVDPETRQSLPAGQQGLILIRGRQVMQGYYKNPEATAKVIDPEGWFDTGDLGWITPQNDLIITGRAKDTIVLTNGENIEPQPIENACARSPYIDQIMLVGQDERSLGALIVPNLDALQQWAASQNLVLRLPDVAQTDHLPQPGAANAEGIDLDSKPIQDLFRQELTQRVKERPGYRADDRIGPFRLLTEPFSVENAMMTQTLKIRRAVVTDRYRGMIDEMFN